MTSNLGSHFFREEKDPARVRGLHHGSAQAGLRPEFLNRIDETVIFQRSAGRRSPRSWRSRPATW